jgi:hypothetical protein
MVVKRDQRHTNKLGDEFTYHYKDVHSCKMKLIEVIPNNKVVWLVLDNYVNFSADKSEWKGTRVIFEICRKDGKTEIRFTHLGLVPEYECFNVCSNAWGSYINGSLRSLIITGRVTQPERKRGWGKGVVESRVTTSKTKGAGDSLTIPRCRACTVAGPVTC